MKPTKKEKKRLRVVDNPFDAEPDYINEKGVRWWKDDDMTLYAQKPDRFGTSLDAVCFYIEEANGRRTRGLISRDQEIMEEDQTLDGLGTKIDLRKFLKRGLH